MLRRELQPAVGADANGAERGEQLALHGYRGEEAALPGDVRDVLEVAKARRGPEAQVLHGEARLVHLRLRALLQRHEHLVAVVGRQLANRGLLRGRPKDDQHDARDCDGQARRGREHADEGFEEICKGRAQNCAAARQEGAAAVACIRKTTTTAAATAAIVACFLACSGSNRPR